MENNKQLQEILTRLNILEATIAQQNQEIKTLRNENIDLRNELNNVELQVDKNKNNLGTINKKKSNDLSLNTKPNNPFFQFEETEGDLEVDRSGTIEEKIDLTINQLETILDNLLELKDIKNVDKELPQFSSNTAFNKAKTSLPIPFIKSAKEKSNEYRRAFYKDFCELGISSLKEIKENYNNERKMSENINEVQYHEALNALKKNMQNISTNKETYDIAISFFKILDDQVKSVDKKLKNAIDKDYYANEEKKTKKQEELEDINEEYGEAVSIAKSISRLNLLFTENTIDSIKRESSAVKFINSEKYKIIEKIGESNYHKWEKKHIIGGLIVAAGLAATGGVVAAVAGTAVAVSLGIEAAVGKTLLSAAGSSTGGVIAALNNTRKEFNTDLRSQNLINLFNGMQESWSGNRVLVDKNQKSTGEKILQGNKEIYGDHTRRLIDDKGLLKNQKDSNTNKEILGEHTRKYSIGNSSIGSSGIGSSSESLQR